MNVINKKIKNIYQIINCKSNKNKIWALFYSFFN